MSRSIRALPPPGKAIVKATNRQPHRKEYPDRREISIGKGWTACLVCRGGPLDLSTVQKKYNASWSQRRNRQQEALGITIKLWIASTQYTGTFHYYLETQDSYIGNTLNNRFELGPVMTAAGFVANQKIFVEFSNNEVWVLRELDAI